MDSVKGMFLSFYGVNLNKQWHSVLVDNMKYEYSFQCSDHFDIWQEFSQHCFQLTWQMSEPCTYCNPCWCAILIAHQIVMAKHGGSCVHFSGISTCGRTSRETVSHSQRQPFPTPHKIALPVYVTVTNKRLQPLTTTLCNSLVLSFSLLTTKRRLIKHRSFLCVLRSSQLCRRC